MSSIDIVKSFFQVLPAQPRNRPPLPSCFAEEADPIAAAARSPVCLYARRAPLARRASPAHRARRACRAPARHRVSTHRPGNACARVRCTARCCTAAAAAVLSIHCGVLTSTPSRYGHPAPCVRPAAPINCRRSKGLLLSHICEVLMVGHIHDGPEERWLCQSGPTPESRPDCTAWPHGVARLLIQARRPMSCNLATGLAHGSAGYRARCRGLAQAVQGHPFVCAPVELPELHSVRSRRAATRSKIHSRCGLGNAPVSGHLL